MRLIFAGTPVFAERALAALIEAGHEIALVLTRADQPAGRGHQLQASPVKRLALAHGLPVFQPRSLRDAQAQARIAEVQADAMVVAAYGLILPAPVLAAPRLGCINIHASLLPRWRGAAPIQRAIEAGDTETGITIMQMDEGLDTGPMLLARSLPIGPEETGGSLHDRLAALGAALIVEAMEALARGALQPVPQPAEGVTYAAKIDKAQTLIDWREPAARLADRVRAFDPFPGTLMQLPGVPGPLKLWRARALATPAQPALAGEGSATAGAGDAAAGAGNATAGAGNATAGAGSAAAGAGSAAAGAGGAAAGAGGAPPPSAGAPPPAEPGTVLAAGDGRLLVACGEGALSLLELQKPGGRRLPVQEFLRGFPVAAGARFALPERG